MLLTGQMTKWPGEFIPASQTRLMACLGRVAGIYAKNMIEKQKKNSLPSSKYSSGHQWSARYFSSTHRCGWTSRQAAELFVSLVYEYSSPHNTEQRSQHPPLTHHPFFCFLLIMSTQLTIIGKGKCNHDRNFGDSFCRPNNSRKYPSRRRRDFMSSSNQSKMPLRRSWSLVVMSRVLKW